MQNDRRSLSDLQLPNPNSQPPALLDLYRFVRFSAFGATAALPLLGAASVRPDLPARDALRLIGAAACFHAFAYIHNDVCDLAVDRSQPLRAAYPLVRGAISPRAALAIALACVPAAFAAGGGDTGRRGRGDMGTVARLPTPDSRLPTPDHYLALAFLLMAAYNRWGKRCPWPPLTDALQGAGWAALLAYGAAAQGRAPNRLTGALMYYELLLIMLVNGVHGPLRDLEGDLAAGARTTAALLGARPAPGGGLHVPPALRGYALALQLAMLAVLGAALARRPPARRAAGLGLALIAAATLALLGAAARGRARPADVGMLHLALILSAPVALVAPGMAPAPRVILMLAHTLPLLANGMTYDALGWLWRAARGVA